MREKKTRKIGENDGDWDSVDSCHGPRSTCADESFECKLKMVFYF